MTFWEKVTWWFFAFRYCVMLNSHKYCETSSVMMIIHVVSPRDIYIYVYIYICVCVYIIDIRWIAQTIVFCCLYSKHIYIFTVLNTLRAGQNDRHFQMHVFERKFLYLIKISQTIVSWGSNYQQVNLDHEKGLKVVIGPQWVNDAFTHCSLWSLYTVRYRYNAVNFLTNIRKRHPIHRPSMGCVLWVQPLFDNLHEFL